MRTHHHSADRFRSSRHRHLRRLPASSTTASRAIVAIGIGCLFVVSACGSDATAPKATDVEVLTREDSPAVDAFCTTTDALVTQISTLASTPGADLTSLQPSVDGINTSAAALVASTPGAATAVATCVASVSVALAGGASATTVAGGTATTVAGGTATTEAGGTATTEAGRTATTVAGGTASSNPAVQAFCDSVDQLAADLTAAIADPSSVDAAALIARAQELAASATTLISANPSDAAVITECVQRLTGAITPGGIGIGGSTATSIAPVGDGAAATMTVEEFCTAAEDLGKQLADALANPAGADVAALAAKTTELSTQAQALILANSADTARITECLQKMVPGA